MPETIPESAFAELFIRNTPLLDVRAPIEYLRGAFPNATNLPLLTDSERAAVGTRYQEAGRDAAYALGTELVSHETRQQRLQQWAEFLHNNPGALLYCFRGGLRSQLVQQWLAERDIAVARIEGGYKALRTFLLDTLAATASNTTLLIVAGKTGSAKTHLINELANSVDLEGIANHRGSAFGRRVIPQPSQIDFENRLAIEFLRLTRGQAKTVFLEDESRAIGSLALPLALHDKMLESSIAVLEETFEFRVDTILNDYIVSNYRELAAASPATAAEEFTDFLLSSLQRIRKRLGGENYAKINSLMLVALERQRSDNEFHLHREWIQLLLRDYYDPMYDYQLNKKLQRVVFRGTRQEFLNWCAHINRSQS